MLTLDLFEDYNKEPEFIQALRDFLPVALEVLELKQLPKIKLKKELGTTNVPTFGRFTNDEQVVYCVITNRHPNDILRTLAHEMAHYAQGERDELDADSWHTGSPIENQANAQAGVIMREFNKQFPKYMSLKPIVFEEWSKKYKDSINCSNPKGFSQKAHCAGKKKHTNEAEDSCPPATQDITLNLKNRQKAINEYGYGPLNPDLPNTKFWMKKVDEWNLDSPDEAKQSLCGNCAAFDQRKDTLDCIAQGIGSEQGADDPTIDAGDLGYCRFLKFKCASRRTCDAWVTGGPLTEGQHCDAKNAVPELKAALTKRKTELKNADAKVAYDKIDKIMTRIAQTYNISGQELHDLWTERYGEIPDTWVLDEATMPAFDPKRSLNLIARSIDEVLQTQRKARGLLNVHNILKHIKEALYYTGNTEHTIPGKYFVLLYQQVKRAEKMNEHPRPDDPAPQAAALTALQGIRNETIPAIQQLLNQSVKENFADGKGPGRAGDSQRHGIPKGATIAQLEKASHSAGRKGQLARWQINMRRGKKK